VILLPTKEGAGYIFSLNVSDPQALMARIELNLPTDLWASFEKGRVTVAGKPGNDLAAGTLNSIYKQAGWK
jgi:hypothetical protein